VSLVEGNRDWEVSLTMVKPGEEKLDGNGEATPWDPDSENGGGEGKEEN